MLPFLSDDEIAQICEPLIAPAAQRRYLAKIGLVVQRKPNGKPLVARAEFDRVLPAARTSAAPAIAYNLTPPVPFAETALGRWQALARAARAQAPKLLKATVGQRRRQLRLAIERRSALVRFHAAKRRAAKLQRTPPWADMDAILAVYQRARELSLQTGVPHHVDHEIPLQGELVSGLHVETNLRAIPTRENIRKSNSFEA